MLDIRGIAIFTMHLNELLIVSNFWEDAFSGSELFRFSAVYLNTYW